MASKRCNDCGEVKPLSEFGLCKGSPRHHCKPCKNAESREWYSKNKERKAELSKAYRETKKDQDLKKMYGIGLEEYNKMVEQHKDCCAICGTHRDQFDKALAVDHDHKTGEIRGLLCGRCNTGIGLFKDDHELLIKAARYLYFR